MVTSRSKNAKEVGGLAVAVASDEANNGSGRFDEWKRQRLLGVGADVVIPDYKDAEALIDVVLGKCDRFVDFQALAQLLPG